MKAIDYKGKHFILCDDDCIDDQDYELDYINIEYVLRPTNFENYVRQSLYYGVPAYIGNDPALSLRINKIYDKINKENGQGE